VTKIAVWAGVVLLPVEGDGRLAHKQENTRTSRAEANALCFTYCTDGIMTVGHELHEDCDDLRHPGNPWLPTRASEAI
jgi:hypothetical protein